MCKQEKNTGNAGSSVDLKPMGSHYKSETEGTTFLLDVLHTMVYRFGRVIGFVCKIKMEDYAFDVSCSLKLNKINRSRKQHTTHLR